VRTAGRTRASVLDEIVEVKREEVARLASRASELRARSGDLERARDFAGSLRSALEVRLLAEVKRRSPSAGPIRSDADAATVAKWYEVGGAAAVSVLTDERFFGGSLADLVRVRAAIGLPVLRKDFVIDPLQILEAHGAGADAVLLIVRILEDGLLTELLGLASELGMAALVEVHDAEELARALAAGAALVGVNNRDLSTFRTELDLSLRLASRVPAGVTLVAESGIRDAADVRRLGEAGVDAILVGESLMRRQDPAAGARSLVGIEKAAGAR
jgi:indole-3-glycerol phosphate synthase